MVPLITTDVDESKTAVIINLNNIASITVLILVLFIIPCASDARTINTAVLYPEAAHPYSQVFSTIIDGIRTQTQINVKSYEITDKTRGDDVKKWLDANPADMLIVLGQKSFDVIANMNFSIPSIVSAVIRPVEPHRCICLSIAPEELIEHLLKIKPEVKRIFFVYSDKNNGWMLPDANAAAKKAGVQLIAKSAENIQEAALQYKSILNNKLGPTDAIWLPLDNILPSDVILPDILKSAWDNKYVIFSTSPFYVKRGGLFALFPDHYKLGQQIAELASQANNTMPERYSHARHYKSTLNVRTARHIGMHISNEGIKQYDIVYPLR